MRESFYWNRHRSFPAALLNRVSRSRINQQSLRERKRRISILSISFLVMITSCVSFPTYEDMEIPNDDTAVLMWGTHVLPEMFDGKKVPARFSEYSRGRHISPGRHTVTATFYAMYGWGSYSTRQYTSIEQTVELDATQGHIYEAAARVVNHGLAWNLVVIDVTLHAKAARGDLNGLQSILDNGADVNLQNEALRTPLHEAAKFGQFECATALIEAGANPNLSDMDLLRSGEAGSKPTARTALHDAADLGFAQIVQLLAENNADLEAHEGIGGCTPLHLAILNGHSDVVRVLLEHGANKDARDTRGRACLELAKKSKNKALMELFR